MKNIPRFIEDIFLQQNVPFVTHPSNELFFLPVILTYNLIRQKLSNLAGKFEAKNAALKGACHENCAQER
jgi:hypothetical protein